MISSIRMTNNTIQQLIKERIPREFMFDFLDTMINEDSIDSYSKLLDLAEVNDKYTFDLIIAILYKEVATLDVLIAMIADPDHNEIFERIVMLEYELYEIPGGFDGSGASNSDSIKLVRDYIPKLYYGDKNRLSYKDEDNLNAELEKLYTGGTPLEDLDELITGTRSFNATSMTRINDQIAYMETEIGLYSFLINYDITNKYFIRKKEALTSGVYRKIEDGVEIEKNFDAIASELYYPYYVTYDIDYENAHNFLLDYYDKILKGTINY